MLSKNNANKAILRKGIWHPVLDEFEKLEKPYKKNYILLANSLDEMYFSIRPLELLSIWSYINERNLPKYETSLILTSSYANREISANLRKGFSRSLLEKLEFPKRFTKNGPAKKEFIISLDELDKITKLLKESAHESYFSAPGIELINDLYENFSKIFTSLYSKLE